MREPFLPFFLRQQRLGLCPR